jgi:uncharacterized membrane protein
MFKDFFNENDPTHSSQRLVFILFAFLIVLIGLAVIGIAFSSGNVAVITALTIFAGTVYGFVQAGKNVSKWIEEKKPFKY